VSGEPLLSLITPVYRGEEFIEASIRGMLQSLEELRELADDRPPFELIVVCDGDLDTAAAIVTAMADPRVRVIRYPDNVGKGFALCAGMAQAKGSLIGWLDSDLDIHPSVIVTAVRTLVDTEVDAAVGSKRHRASAVDYPATRRLLSWGFQRLTHLLLRVGVPDTQVGAKVFRREVIATALPLLRVKRYAFDLEVLAVAAQFGFDRVAQVPVALEYRFTGTGINVHAVWNMFKDTLAVGYRVHTRWYVHQFARMHRRRLLASPAEDDEVRLPAVADGNLALFRQVNATSGNDLP
jgi:glycosyltransferase involved in cell wall biosynthesis